MIGRFGSHSNRNENSQPKGTVEEAGDQSAGIGRFEGETDKPFFARENHSGEPDRPGLRQIHGTGAVEGEGVVERAGVARA